MRYTLWGTGVVAILTYGARLLWRLGNATVVVGAVGEEFATTLRAATFDPEAYRAHGPHPLDEVGAVDPDGYRDIVTRSRKDGTGAPLWVAQSTLPQTSGEWRRYVRRYKRGTARIARRTR